MKFTYIKTVEYLYYIIRIFVYEVAFGIVIVIGAIEFQKMLSFKLAVLA